MFGPLISSHTIMLTGSDLLNKVKELGDVSKSDLVRACGYVSDKKDGGERLNFTAFYEALLEAKGVNLGIGAGAGVGKGGRKLSYIATVQGNGNLLIGKAYTQLLDLKPGDEFEIKLGRKQIRLVPVGGSDEDEE
ncbi:Transcriptional regulator AbrB [Synechococcus sp. RS9917]|nr:Transcriptional regulator AbrB [Synechococcus sp. RS9917]